MITALTTLAGVLAASPIVEHQHLEVALAPDAHTAAVTSRLRARGAGELRLRLIEQAEIAQLLLDGAPADFDRAPDAQEPRVSILTVTLPGPRSELLVRYGARFVEDVAAGERPGEIHNKSVEAHVGPDGIFLADGAAWHPLPLAADGRPALHAMAVDVEPLEGWAIVASGDPVAHLQSIDEPVWNWRTPRPVDGMALVGGQHELYGRLHASPRGPVEVVMHVPSGHKALAPMFVDAACTYLDLYTPLLGPFPYKRFSIVENFFSSGFAYPGFTVLGPRVVGMAPRSLMPGFLDHELVHNWWGNGVYVDPDDGNWCEAMASLCANYFRRIVDEGEEAGLVYRRGTLMKLSSDPESLDDGPLGAFGRDEGPDRFVGYDKGAFFFIMLGRLYSYDADRAADEVPWTSLRRFAEIHMGRRADWADIQEAFETTIAPEKVPGWLDDMFALWVREHTVPKTIPGDPARARAEFAAQFERGWHVVPEATGGGRDGFEIDADFTLYRILPPEQVIPTVVGTTGAGGLAVEADRSRPAVEAFLGRLEPDPAGENLLILGGEMVRPRADLIERTSDPIRVGDGSFTVGGVTYDAPSQTVLHTMQYPGRPGRFITVFHSNGDAGWSRLRLILFYSRDTTIVWDDGRVIDR
ncbi:MAG: M1 aminopeptidase family protein, partial [Planctomycetota bacterium]